MATDLITSERAAQNGTLSALAASNAPYLRSLIGSASDAVRKQTHRDFVQSSYSEYYTLPVQYRDTPLLLRQWPVIEVTRVAQVNQCLLVQNSAQSCQRATVETTATGITVMTVASGVKTTTPLLYATYPTIQAIANAITAIGSGWSTSISGGSNGSYALWPSADLKPLQGAASAFGGGAWLEIYEDVQSGSANGFGWGFDGSDDGWCGNGGTGWRLDAENGEMHFRMRRGPLVLRIDYTAGFAQVPQVVQEATVQLVQFYYQSSLVNNTYASVKLGDAAVTLAHHAMPKSIAMMLAQYVDHARVISR